MSHSDEWTYFNTDEEEESDGIEENASVKSQNTEGSSSSFDLCEEFPDNVKKNESNAECSNLGSDFDLCDEFDDVETSSSDESQNSIASAGYSSSDSLFQLNDSHNFLCSDIMMTELEHNSCDVFQEVALREILKEHALPFLPAKSLVRFKSVTKKWNDWIASPFLSHKQSYSFRKMSGYFYQGVFNNDVSFLSPCERAYGVPTPSLSFLPQETSIKSSCNGLVLCQARDEDKTYYICNPATEKWKALPRPAYYHGENPSMVLAFEPSVLNMGAHYQVVCIFSRPDEPVFCFEIYSSETNTWKLSEALCVELQEWMSFENNSGLYFNGMVYWETTSNEVVAYDLKNEIHGVFELPSTLPTGGILAAMGGELCYICVPNFLGPSLAVEVHGGMNMELKRSVRFDVERIFDGKPFRVLPNVDEGVAMVFVGGVIYSFDLRLGVFGVVKGDETLDGAGKYIPYVNTLVDLA